MYSRTTTACSTFVTSLVQAVTYNRIKLFVESAHKTLNTNGEGNLATWEAKLPRAEYILWITPLESLVGRSPYQVGIALVPKLPQALISGQVVAPMGIKSYAETLMKFYSCLSVTIVYVFLHGRTNSCMSLR